MIVSLRHTRRLGPSGWAIRHLAVVCTWCTFTDPRKNSNGLLYQEIIPSYFGTIGIVEFDIAKVLKVRLWKIVLLGKEAIRAELWIIFPSEQSFLPPSDGLCVDFSPITCGEGKSILFLLDELTCQRSTLGQMHPSSARFYWSDWNASREIHKRLEMF